MPSDASPTWQTIKTFFTALDIEHMAPRGLVLDDFAAVKADAESILDAVDSGFMPPGRRWAPDRVETFRRWLDAGCPEGEAETPTWRPTTATSATTFGFRYDDICFLTPEKGWAVNSNGQILHTEDGGTIWVKQFQTPIEGILPIYLRCIRFASPTVGWAGTISGSTRLFGTTDGGTTWTTVPLPPESPPKICGLSVVDENVIYASGTNEPRDPCAIVKTVDGGRTWTARSMEDHASSLVDILFFDADHGFVVGGKTDDPSPGHQDLTPVVLETTDGGDTWVNRVADLEFPVGEWGWKLQFVDDNLGFVALESFDHGAILETLDGGKAWQRLPINDPQENKNLEGVGFIDPQVGWVGGWGDALFQSGKTSSTRDGGQTWQDANDVGSFINRFWFFEGRDDIAYASGRTVYKFSTDAAPPPTLAELMPTRGFLEPTALQATDRGIRFDYTLPDGARSVWLHVWDRFGNVVRTVAHEEDAAPGSHSVTWDRRDDSGEAVQPGSYIYRLTVDDEAESGVTFLQSTA